MSASALISSDGFAPPSSASVNLPPIFSSIEWLTKPVLMALLSTVVIVGFFWAATRRTTLVPSRLQFTGELVYDFVRMGIGRDLIGSREFRPFVPLLFSLFTFILVNNVFGITPLLYYPTMARVGFPLALALIVLVVYNAVGIRRQGFVTYFKDVMFIPGVPKFVYPILAPIELLTILVIRPFTLTLRLFANMFAGHLLLLVFILGADYMIFELANPILKTAGVLTGAFTVLFTFFELFVEVFQAYIFALLSALYISGAVNEGH